MLLFYGIAVLMIIIDQITKWLIVKNLELYEVVSVIGDFFAITSHRNQGAAFGILQNQRWFFILITIVIVCGIIWYLHKQVRERKRLLPLALSLVLGGAIGNFIDRARHGEVVDFFQFHFVFNFFGKAIDYIFPIFNVADSCIVVGVGLILVDSLIAWRNEKRGVIS